MIAPTSLAAPGATEPRSMPPRDRRATLLLLLATLAAAVVLAMGLPALRLSPGLPLPEVTQGRIFVEAHGQAGPALVPVRWAVLAILGAGAGAVVLWASWRALRGARLLSLVPAALRAVLLVSAACAAVVAVLLLVPGERARLPEVPLPPPVAAPRSPLGAPPALVLWLTAAGLLAAAALAAAWILRSAPPASRRALDLVAREAESARDALLAGDDARGVILACYARMSAALAEHLGIERARSTTAREFEELLGGLGVPRGPVHELTRLFEAVRYGGSGPTEVEGARALACLGPIVDHCRGAAREA